MHWQLLLFSMLPLLAYVLVSRSVSHRSAVFSALAVAVLECVHNSLLVGFLEPFSTASLGLFVLLGVLSLKPDWEVLFKFQPVALGVGAAAAFWFYDARAGDGPTLLPLIMERYVGVNEMLPSYQHGYFRVYAETLSRSLPFLLVLHAVCTGWAALTLSTLGWFLVRVVGFYAGVAALFLAERLLGVT